MAKPRPPKTSGVQRSAEKPFPQWRPAERLPENEDLLIVFHGLLSFCYRDKAGVEDRLHCEVGVLNQDPKHQLRIRIEGGTCAGAYEYTHDQLKLVAEKSFRIEIEGAIPNVDFYQAAKTFNRETATGPEFDNDFRWLIDVETPDLYNDEVRRKKKHYGPKLMVKNGTFFTQEKTHSTFKFVERRSGGDEPPLGSIAFCSAAKIKLKSGERAKFTFIPPGAKKPIDCFFSPKESGKPPAKIFFTNLCYKDGKVCKDSDFHLHFATFEPPPGKRHYDLKVVNPVSATHECGGLRSFHDIKETEFGTDEAPCHAMGYGLTGGGTP